MSSSMSDYALRVGAELFSYKGGDSRKIQDFIERNIVEWYNNNVAPVAAAAYIALACGMTEREVE